VKPLEVELDVLIISFGEIKEANMVRHYAQIQKIENFNISTA
jgi:hypothetical protein